MVRIALILTSIAGIIGVHPVQAGTTSFGWAKKIGGASYDEGVSLTIDGNGNIYTTGNFSGTVDFDPGTGISNLTSAGDVDIYISKLDTNGNFVWAKRMGGTLSDSGKDIVLDGNGNIYSLGGFYGTVDFNPGAGINNLTSVGSSDIYISKLDVNGNYVWAKNVGGAAYDWENELIVDEAGNVYITGSFSGTADFDPGAGLYNLTSAGSDDIFIAKFDDDGNLVWAKSMGGANDDSGTSLALDDSGNLYSAGDFWGNADLDPGAGVYNLSSKGYYDIYISKLDMNGEFVWAKSVGGTATDSPTGIEIDSAGYVYSTGSFHNTVDFDPGAGISNLTSNGYWDFYISKYDNNGNFVWARTLGGTLSDNSYGIELDTSGNVYTIGGFVSTVDFDPGIGIYNLSSAGNGDVFISSLDTNGNFVWAKNMGGTGNDYGWNLVLNEQRDVFSIGDFSGTADFDPGSGTYNLTGAGYNDIFINKLISDVRLISGNVGVAGATLSYMDNGPQTVTADGSGDYSITAPYGWSGTVTPYETGYTFSPVNRTYGNVQNNQPGQNYTAQVCVNCADISVTIAGAPLGNYTLPSMGSVTPYFNGLAGGPVRVQSTNAMNILTSEHRNYQTSFSETLGYPDNQLTTEYWFTRYAYNANVKTWLLIANPSGSTANVSIYIGNLAAPIESFSLISGASTTKFYDGLADGPVRVVSTNGVDILASEHRNYQTSFSETLGYPADQLATAYWFTRYAYNANVKTWLLVTNPSGSNADVEIYIGDLTTPIDSFSLTSGASATQFYDGVANGPVRVVSTNGVDILASEHRNYQTSFSETLGYPDDQLTTQYWFTKYAYNANVKTWILVTNPSNSSADVEIYIGNSGTPQDTFTLAAGASVSKFYDGVANGPVLDKSTNGVNILASEHRNYQTSFSETLGYPANQLTTKYWFTRYAYNANVKTWLLITKP